MPLSIIPQMFDRETLTLMDTALEQAWQELRNDDGVADAEKARRKLARTIIALASVGETDLAKLKNFALHASRAVSSPQRLVALQQT
jgi:hypothetical protein